MQEVKQKWQQVLNIIKDNIDEESFKAWFEPIIPISYINNILKVQVPTHFFYEYIEEHFINLLGSSLKRIFGPAIELEYKIVLDTSVSVKNEKKSTVTILATPQVHVENNPISIPNANKPTNPFIIPGLKKYQINSQLDSKLNFENFIIGSCNKLGANVGIKVAEHPGTTSFNPLVIHGASGIGKSHLANAIGLKTKEINPEKTVFFTTAFEFQTKYTDAVRYNTVNDFINFFQAIDVLIVDDIQDFKGKEATQKTFFNIFEFFHKQNKQLILTADRPLSELEGFYDRLLTRFKWGLTAELLMPDFETRLEIVRRKAKQSGVDAPERVLELIASTVKSSIRELEGALLSILVFSTVENTSITLDIAKRKLKNLVSEKKVEFTAQQIIDIVCQFLQIPEKAIAAKTRKQDVVQARHLSMYFLREIKNMSLESIGEMLGGRDHSSVVHALKSIQNSLDTDKDFANLFDEIKRALGL